MVTGEKLREALQKYMPQAAVEDCVSWIQRYRISVRIKHTRSSRYGDYHPPQAGKSHTITINHDLNPYAFLITFTHEVAHLTCFLKHRHAVLPHGEEWKSEFRYLLSGFLHKAVFPKDVAEALLKYIQNPAASSCSDLSLMKALSRYDEREEGWMLLEDVPPNATFTTGNGKVFIKGPKLRKNYSCIDTDTRYRYTVHPLLEVKLLEQ